LSLLTNRVRVDIVLLIVHGDIAVRAWSPCCAAAFAFERTVPLPSSWIALVTVTETVTVPLAHAVGAGVVVTAGAFSPFMAATRVQTKRPVATNATQRTTVTANIVLNRLFISILESFETIVEAAGHAINGLRERCVVARRGTKGFPYFFSVRFRARPGRTRINGR
jgi:hypothetical protein